MKTMKKLTALLLALTAILSFATTAACGGNKPSSNESSSSENVGGDPSIDESYVPEPPETNWSEWELVTEPTCTTDGSKIRFDVSDETVSQTARIPARGHD